MPSVITIINTIDQFVWSPDVICDSFQHINTVRIRGDVVLCQTHSVTILVVEFHAIQTDIIWITPSGE